MSKIGQYPILLANGCPEVQKPASVQLEHEAPAAPSTRTPAPGIWQVA